MPGHSSLARRPDASSCELRMLRFKRADGQMLHEYPVGVNLRIEPGSLTIAG
jgi:hypothetical protein